jgi:hypothetical protein
MLIDGKEVQVGMFVRRDTRPDQASWTNCFIKNIPYEWDEERLRKEFEPFGEIASVSISMGKRKVFPKKKKAEKKEGEEGTEKSEEEKVSCFIKCCLQFFFIMLCFLFFCAACLLPLIQFQSHHYVDLTISYHPFSPQSPSACRRRIRYRRKPRG